MTETGGLEIAGLVDVLRERGPDVIEGQQIAAG
jgi:hypothetical protein